MRERSPADRRYRAGARPAVRARGARRPGLAVAASGAARPVLVARGRALGATCSRRSERACPQCDRGALRERRGQGYRPKTWMSTRNERLATTLPRSLRRRRAAQERPLAAPRAARAALTVATVAAPIRSPPAAAKATVRASSRQASSSVPRTGSGSGRTSPWSAALVSSLADSSTASASRNSSATGLSVTPYQGRAGGAGVLRRPPGARCELQSR